MRKINYAIIILLLSGCSITKDKATLQPIYRIQGGLNKGGITENTDFTKTPEIQADAFSGATKTGFNTGAHAVIPLKRNSLETGVDFMYNKQTFTYNDNTNSYNGTRNIGCTQVLIPITYNFGLFRKKDRTGSLQLKVGYLMQLNMFSVADQGINLTEYSLKHFSNGLTVGFSATPVHFENGGVLGFYLDGYRGTKLFDDYYNSSNYEMPGSSFVKFGIIYQFGRK